MGQVPAGYYKEERRPEESCPGLKLSYNLDLVPLSAGVGLQGGTSFYSHSNQKHAVRF